MTDCSTREQHTAYDVRQLFHDGGVYGRMYVGSQHFNDLQGGDDVLYDAM